MPLVCRATAGLSQGRGFDDGKPYSAHSPSVKFPRPAEIKGVRRLYIEFRGFLLEQT
jgi:hypothetical protein